MFAFNDSSFDRLPSQKRQVFEQLDAQGRSEYVRSFTGKAQHAHAVVMTSYRRRCDVMTSHRQRTVCRHFGVMCQLGNSSSVILQYLFSYLCFEVNNIMSCNHGNNTIFLTCAEVSMSVHSLVRTTLL